MSRGCCVALRGVALALALRMHVRGRIVWCAPSHFLPPCRPPRLPVMLVLPCLSVPPAQPDLAYNVSLCYYKMKQYGSALKHLGEIVEKGVRFHPELSIGSNNEMTAARSVGNSQLLKETALIESFNLKVGWVGLGWVVE